MATKVSSEKKVDVPPRGDRNADPITNESGSHPVETGIGAAVAGAATGMAVGAFTGPVGAAVGAAVGAVAGGYAGKGVGEMIDPTIDDNWLRDNFSSRPYVKKGETFDTYVPAFRYGGEAEHKYGHDDFESIEPELEERWTSTDKNMPMPWIKARSAVKDAYDRTILLRTSRPCPDECDVQED